MSAMGVMIDQFDVPVCNSFQAKILNDQLCSQCSAADCVLIFIGAAACTAPKFCNFTEANMCVLSLVQCAAQHRHQTILMCLEYRDREHMLWIVSPPCCINPRNCLNNNLKIGQRFGVGANCGHEKTRIEAVHITLRNSVTT